MSPILSWAIALLLWVGSSGILSAQAESDWPTEALAALAGERMKSFGKLVETRNTDLNHWHQKGLLAPEAKFTALIPKTLAPQYRNSGITVVSGRPSSEPTPPLQALKNLYARFPGTAPIRSHFKIDHIEIDVEQVTTGVVASLTSGSVAQESRWKLRWRRADEALSLVSLEVESFEETALTADRPRLFEECTDAVFGSTSSFSDQLAFSNEYWRSRIESHHVFDKFGHQGLALGDVDGDGLDDLYVCQPGGLPNRLYRHLPNGTVEDISAASETDWLDNTRSALFVDFDNNGTQDLILGTSPGIVFLRNDGRGHFQPVNVIQPIRDAYSLAAADADNDGDLDLYVCRYYPLDADVQSLPIPVPYDNANNGGENFLIRNDGQWRTSNATQEAGLHVNNRRYSYAAIWVDTDRDGDQDLFVANDFGRNNLFRNDGGTFTDVTESTGLGASAFGMSAAAGDYNRDGREDLYVGNMFSSAGSRVTQQDTFKPTLSASRRQQFRHLARGNALFTNRGAQGFQNHGPQAGVALGRWSWGSVFADINNDGWEDLLVTNGYLTGPDPDDL